MDLADLLAREGYAAPDLSALVSWARGRAGALIASLADDSPLRPLLSGASGHVVTDMPRRSAEALAVAAEEGAPIDLRRAVTAATAPHPVAEPDDAESGLGGFARFGGMVRMNRPYPYREQEEPVEERPALVRSFALAAEKEAEERDEPPAAAVSVPPPPGELTGMLPQAALGISAEESGGLVVGIPDDDAGDVPVPRSSSASAAHRRGTGAFMSGVLVDDDDASVMINNLTSGRAETQVAAESAVHASPGVTESAVVDLRKPVPASQDPLAPVLRQRSGKKKIVELGAPVARPKSGSKATATIVPRSGPTPQAIGKRPPPPPGARRPTATDEDIQELSRVEMIDDLPAYLRDDEG